MWPIECHQCQRPGVILSVISVLQNLSDTHMLLAVCFNANRKVYMARMFNCHVESEGFLKVTGSNVQFRSCNVSETVQDSKIFTACRNALYQFRPSVCPSVYPSVCLSHAGIVSKRLHVAWCSLCCQIAKCV